LGTLMFHAAHLTWMDLPTKDKMGRSSPLWHRVWGGNYVSLRDTKVPEKQPCLLVISNISSTSTREKLEKVRDLIVKHPNIPKILIVSTATNPCKYVMDNLFLPVQNFLYLSPQVRVTEK